MTVKRDEVRAQDGAKLRDFITAEQVKIGDAVYLDGDGKARKASNSTAERSRAIGIAVAISPKPLLDSETAEAGRAISVCTDGVVTGFSGLTANKEQYVAATAGVLVESKGSNPFSLGRAISDTAMVVNSLGAGGESSSGSSTQPTILHGTWANIKGLQVDGAHNSGATEISIDDTSNQLRFVFAGDHVLIDDESYAITAVDNTGDTITISPGLRSSKSGDEYVSTGVLIGEDDIITHDEPSRTLYEIEFNFAWSYVRTDRDGLLGSGAGSGRWVHYDDTSWFTWGQGDNASQINTQINFVTGWGIVGILNSRSSPIDFELRFHPTQRELTLFTHSTRSRNFEPRISQLLVVGR